MTKLMLQNSADTIGFLRCNGLLDEAVLVSLFSDLPKFAGYLRSKGVGISASCDLSEVRDFLYNSFDWVKYAKVVCVTLGIKDIGVFCSKFGNKLDDDHLKGIQHALSTLTPKQLQLISEKYLVSRNVTDECVGEKLNMSKQRVSQALNSAFSCLRHPSRSGFILRGFSVETERRRLLADTKKYNNSEKSSELKHLLSTRPLHSIPIEYCNFSERTYNVLHRGGIHHLSDIRSQSQIRNFRNAGMKTVAEVLSFFEKNGLTLPE